MYLLKKYLFGIALFCAFGCLTFAYNSPTYGALPAVSTEIAHQGGGGGGGHWGGGGGGGRGGWVMAVGIVVTVGTIIATSIMTVVFMDTVRIRITITMIILLLLTITITNPMTMVAPISAGKINFQL